MYKKSPQGWLKHWDFILLDIFCLQLAFVVAYLVRQGLENPYSDQIYRTVAFVFMLCQIVVMFLGQSYQDILKRGYYIEFTKTAKHVLMVMLLSVLYLFATQQAVSYSRLTLFYTAFLYLCFDYVGRVWHKENVLKKNATKKKEKSMVVVVSLAEAKETIEKILSAPIQNFSINGIALIDDNPGVKEIAGIPVVGNMDTISEYLCHEWVDEVFVKISETEPYPQKLIDEIIIMGLTVHLSLGEMEKSLSGKNFIEKIGGYSVITSSINTASPKQLLYKRLMDIAGGIVGCLLTVILIVVIGPMIYIKSPGPIFFSQVRIGKNGKKFKIYAKQFNITKLKRIVTGGATGQESIYNGLKAIKEDNEETKDIVVIIHDGNRPMLPQDVITDNLVKQKLFGSAVTVIPTTEVVFVSKDGEESNVALNREELWRTQTPHSYRFDELWTVHNQAIEDGVINMAASCLLMQKYGYTTYFSKGSEKNIKITTVEDIEIFKALLSAKNDEWIKK